MRAIVLLATALTFGGALAENASAGPRYGARYAPPQADPYAVDPFDLDTPTAFVFMRHNARCEYPRGFNVTDFSRNLNGIPRGGDALLATGCGSFEPLSD